MDVVMTGLRDAGLELWPCLSYQRLGKRRRQMTKEAQQWQPETICSLVSFELLRRQDDCLEFN